MIYIIAEILTVGTEILLGNIVNSNAAFLSRELAALGVAVYTHTAVGDNHERLAAALEHAFGKADMVITTGGLGPTQDDITQEVAERFFGEAARTELPNHHGTAAGLVYTRADGKILMMFPGPPHELQPMFLGYAADFLRQKTGRVFVSRTLKIIGRGELEVETMLRDLIDTQTNPTIAPYAKVGEVHIRLTASGALPLSSDCSVDVLRETQNINLVGMSPRSLDSSLSHQEADSLISPIADEIYRRLGVQVYAEDDTSLAETVLNLLREQGLTLAVAESCTGGLVASELVSVSGCSAVFREGFVTYSNEAKIERLGICKDLLARHGAVSAEVAMEMAKNAAEKSGACVGLSTTGIAGPEGGSAEKPVGLVYMGLYVNGELTSEKHNFKGSRNAVRTRAMVFALDFLRRGLLSDV